MDQTEVIVAILNAIGAAAMLAPVGYMVVLALLTHTRPGKIGRD